MFQPLSSSGGAWFLHGALETGAIRRVLCQSGPGLIVPHHPQPRMEPNALSLQWCLEDSALKPQRPLSLKPYYRGI